LASTPEDFQDVFGRIEAAVDAGNTDLSALGYWRLLREVKKDPVLSRHWAEVAGRIDRKAFEKAVRLRFPVWVGNAVLVAGTAAGGGALAFGVLASDPVQAGIALVASAGILTVSLHDLAHWVSGRRRGIRFLCYFLDGPFKIQPGLKTDYATYLSAAPEERAAMHAAGAIASKVAPFIPLLFWWRSSAPVWAAAALGAIAAVQIVTDVVWSTKKADWKKVRREMAFARVHRAARR
jgi:hypothetical protein